MRTPKPGDAIYDRDRPFAVIERVLGPDDFAPDAWLVTPACSCTARPLIVVDRAGVWRRV